MLFSGLPVVFMIGMVSEMTEEGILTRLKDLHLRMFAYALGMLRDRQDAEDVLQEAEIAIWQKHHQVHNPKSFTGWAFRILRNKIYDHLRRVKYRMEHEFLIDETILEMIGDASPDPERRLIQLERLRRVHQALSSLNYRERETVLLRLAGLSNSEIADQIEQPEGNVRSRHTRAIEKIRGVMRSREEPNSYAG
jgi:RNA polymerase sigma-70 factor, ECF subfamily